ncbi:MAG TPA: biotin/lipoyl-binding protein [bacterium]|nr:biotin/lipoyl-binding protein [bacterium]HPN31807.1 biotin/lipoyl-binding protein [bacterium]
MKKYNIKVNNQNFLVDVEQLTPEKLNMKINNNVYEVSIEELIPILKNKDIDQEKNQNKPVIINQTISPAENIEPQIKSMRAPMAGIITAVSIKTGDNIKRGDMICVMDSMKMESEIFSSIAGTVKNVYIKKNDAVKNNQILFDIE